MKPGGWAILNPHLDLSLEKTFEDPSVTAPADRLRLFHQEDHYRVYGRDITKRIAEAGFDAEMIHYMDEIPVELQEKYFLKTTGVIVLGRKPLKPAA